MSVVNPTISYAMEVHINLMVISIAIITYMIIVMAVVVVMI